MICVGIDVAKDKHDCVILNSEGKILAGVFTIPNNADGFDTLLQKIRSCTSSDDKIKVGLEATGHYSYNILGFLINQGLPTYVINPLPKIHRVAKRIEVFENVLLRIVVGILFIADILYHKGIKLLNRFLNGSCRSCAMRYCPATFHASHWQWKHDIHLISINLNLTIINTIRSVFVTKYIPFHQIMCAGYTVYSRLRLRR